MKFSGLIIVISFLLLFPLNSYSSPLESIRISLAEGDVQIKTEDTGDWVPASINLPLSQGDQIWVPEAGRTELRLRDGTALRLDEKSALDILTIDKNSFQFYLPEGRSYINVRGLKDSVLQIDTPLTSIRSYERSTFRIDVSADGLTDITVYSGVVYAETKEGQTQVDAGSVLSIGVEGYGELYALASPDEWEKWNQDRDRRYIVQALPSRYLPDELDIYSGELAENGTWVSDNEYGYVWTPTVVVSSDWAPYKVGRWIWRGGDYLWVSYEPWGWVPHHYGRWVFIRARGWCWVPPKRGEVYWGPGFVGWVQTTTYVSWVPLAPGEIYYGHGHFGPHSVNITNINIANIQISRTVYRNIHVQNAVTIIHRDTFITGKYVDIRVRENPFLKEKINIGRPDIRPIKATMMPVIKEIPTVKLPPRQINEIKPMEIKAKRPIVMERNASVLRPGLPQKEMSIRTKEGRPFERRIERPTERRPPEKEAVKPLERRPVEREGIKPLERRYPDKVPIKPEDRKPLDRGIEKPGERRPIEREVVKPQERRPGEREGIKPLEKRKIDRDLAKPEERKPLEREIGKLKEPRPIDREGVKPLERRPVEREGIKPLERRPAEKIVEKPEIQRPLERRPLEPRVEKPVGKVEVRKETQKPPLEPRTPERAKELKPAEPIKPREIRPQEKTLERPPERRPVEKQVEKPSVQRPIERQIEKPIEKRAPQATPPERPAVQKPAERQIEKPAVKVPERPVDQRPVPKVPERPAVQKQPERQIEKPSQPPVQPAPVQKAPEKPVVQPPPVQKSPERPVQQPVQQPTPPPAQSKPSGVEQPKPTTK